MECPNCGKELEEHFRKVPLPMPFASPKTRERLKGTKKSRAVYECTGCGKFYIRTLALVEVPAGDVE